MNSINFADHPITAYDPFYTRDHNLWYCAWDDYRSDIKRRLESCESRKDTHPILTEFVNTVQKIYAYERATGTLFLSTVRSDGRLNNAQSYIRLLYSV